LSAFLSICVRARAFCTRLLECMSSICTNFFQFFATVPKSVQNSSMLRGFRCEFRRGHHVQKARRLVGLRDFDFHNDRKRARLDACARPCVCSSCAWRLLRLAACFVFCGVFFFGGVRQWRFRRFVLGALPCLLRFFFLVLSCSFLCKFEAK